jgi:uncharacterized membrane protein
MNLLRRSMVFLVWCLGALVIAGIVHIVSILAMPGVASKDAYARLAAFVAPSRLTLLPPARPGQELMPFLDPAMARGVCLYDLTSGPMHLQASVEGDGFLSLSFHSRVGRVFYSMNDRAALRGKIDVLLVTADQLEAIEAEDEEDEQPRELRLTAATPQGFVLLSALAEHPGDVALAEGRILSASCTTESMEQK